MPLSRRQAIQTLMAMPAVASIQTLALTPNDTLVIQCDEILSSSECERIKATMQNLFPGQRCAVLAKGMTLKVVNG